MNQTIKEKLLKKLDPRVGKHDELFNERRIPFQDVSKYYPTDDLLDDYDVKLSDKLLVDLILEDPNTFDMMARNCYHVDNLNIYIPPNTHQSEINKLYCMLIDESENITYPMGNEDVPLMNVGMKNAFYEFCVKHS